MTTAGQSTSSCGPIDVAVIVVNYGTAGLAIAAVESVLARGHDGLTVAIHLVDNASPGDDAARIAAAGARWGERVRLHLETTNHGFGRGNNLVLHALTASATSPRYVYLLNPDASLKTEVIAELHAFLENHPRAAVVGSGIDRPEDGAPLVCAFRFPTMLSEFVDAIGFGPLSRLFASSAVPLPAETPTGPVDWVAGASMMARLSALREIGCFDPDYFLYYEEVDLMKRLRGKGWETWHCAEARITHVAGAATGVHGKDTKRRRRPYYWYDSWRLYFEKNHGRAYARVTSLLLLLGNWLGGLVDRLRCKPVRSPARFTGDFILRVIRPLFVAPARENQ
jgi:N-acetylglucosaminyl-diphospho-decaprenol L-rhamnosyltransferase